MKDTPFQIITNDNSFEITPNEAKNLDLVAIDARNFHILSDSKAYKAEFVSIDRRTKTFTIKVNGNLYTSKISDKYDRLIDQMGMKIGKAQRVGDVKAPMPGLVLEVSVEVGQTVSKGDKVLILEAMKMENVIKAAGDGVVKAIHITKGTAVEKGQLLIEMA